MRNLVVAALLALSLAPSAHALEAGLLGGVDFSSATRDVSPATRNTSPGAAYGALLDASALIPLPLVGLEIDALIVNRKHEVSSKVDLGALGSIDAKVTSKFQHLMVPAIVRFTGLPWINPGFGAYFAPPLAKSTTSVEASGISTESESGMAPDYGLLGSIQLKYPVAPLTSLIVDGRYVLGLKDYEGMGKFRDWQILAGVSIGF